MILIVTQTFAPCIGGMEGYMTGLATQLSATGYKTCVMADAIPKGKSDTTLNAPYMMHRFGGWRPLRRWRKRRAIRALAAQISIKGVFCDSWKSVESLPETLTAPIAVLAHGSEFPSTPSPIKRKRIARALARARSLLANSHFTAHLVRTFLPDAQDARLSILYPPISPLPPASITAQTDITTLIAGRHPVLSTIARLEPRKGVDSIIQAMPALLKKYPSLFYIVAGNGDDRQRLQELARAQGVDSHVTFMGWIDADQKSAILQNSDLFVMPTRRVGLSVEGFGATYIEAAWFGVPSLGARDCGADDAILDKQTGWLCDGNDVNDITARLDVILSDGETRRVFGLAAQRRVQQQLTWQVSLPHFLAALGLAPRIAT